MISVYVDVCCYCRRFDNPGHMEQERVRQEAAAIMEEYQKWRQY